MELDLKQDLLGRMLLKVYLGIDEYGMVRSYQNFPIELL
jgi:hypothetical protein